MNRSVHPRQDALHGNMCLTYTEVMAYNVCHVPYTEVMANNVCRTSSGGQNIMACEQQTADRTSDEVDRGTLIDLGSNTAI